MSGHPATVSVLGIQGQRAPLNLHVRHMPAVGAPVLVPLAFSLSFVALLVLWGGPFLLLGGSSPSRRLAGRKGQQLS